MILRETGQATRGLWGERELLTLKRRHHVRLSNFRSNLFNPTPLHEITRNSFLERMMAGQPFKDSHLRILCFPRHHGCKYLALWKPGRKLMKCASTRLFNSE